MVGRPIAVILMLLAVVAVAPQPAAADCHDGSITCLCARLSTNINCRLFSDATVNVYGGLSGDSASATAWVIVEPVAEAATNATAQVGPSPGVQFEQDGKLVDAVYLNATGTQRVEREWALEAGDAAVVPFIVRSGRVQEASVLALHSGPDTHGDPPRADIPWFAIGLSLVVGLAIGIAIGRMPPKRR